MIHGQPLTGSALAIMGLGEAERPQSGRVGQARTLREWLKQRIRREGRETKEAKQERGQRRESGLSQNGNADRGAEGQR